MFWKYWQRMFEMEMRKIGDLIVGFDREMRL